MFDTHPFDRNAFLVANDRSGLEISFFETGLDQHTATLASTFPAVCCLVNDRLDADILAILKAGHPPSRERSGIRTDEARRRAD